MKMMESMCEITKYIAYKFFYWSYECIAVSMVTFNAYQGCYQDTYHRLSN